MARLNSNYSFIINYFEILKMYGDAIECLSMNAVTIQLIKSGEKMIFCKISTGGQSSAGYESSKIDPFNFGADKISQF